MASGSVKEIGVWRVLSGELIKILTDYKDIVGRVVFSPNGEYLTTESYDKTIGVWRVSSGERVQTLTGFKDLILTVYFLRTESIWRLD